ncbi:hypothetical protein BD309DRAFT_974798 [Dichomitus squalens]|nr:hypothetical protein BD309DRAFT_974798 [Dichomitus squalens]
MRRPGNCQKRVLLHVPYRTRPFSSSADDFRKCVLLGDFIVSKSAHAPLRRLCL